MARDLVRPARGVAIWRLGAALALLVGLVLGALLSPGVSAAGPSTLAFTGAARPPSDLGPISAGWAARRRRPSR